MPKDFLAEKSNASLEDEARTLTKQKDYSSEVKAVIDRLVPAVKDNTADLESTLIELLSWEKKTRLASDVDSTIELARTIMDLCFELKDWTALNEQIVLLSKRRAQLIKVVKFLVTHAMEYLEKTPTIEIKKELIKTLREVSDGKLFLELERAELTRTLAKILEDHGDIQGAADVLLETAVETVGSMEFKDRADFLIEQLRLCVLKKDRLRTELTLKKLRTKQFSNPEWKDLKLRLNTHLVTFFTYINDFAELAKAWKAIYEVYFGRSLDELKKSDVTSEMKDEDSTKTTSEQNSSETKDTAQDSVETSVEDTLFPENETTLKWQEALKKTIIFAILAPYDYESKEFRQRLVEFEKSALQTIPDFYSFLKLMTDDSIISWPIEDYDKKNIQDIIFADSIFDQEEPSVTEKTHAMTDEGPAENKTVQVTQRYDGDKLREIFKQRIIQKNLVVFSKRYTKMYFSRISDLLSVSPADVESALSELIISKQIVAKINSPQNTVSFAVAKKSSDILDAWSADCHSLLTLIEKTSNLIQKENMLVKKTNRV